MRIFQILAAATALVAGPTMASAQVPNRAEGLWMNPHETVAVRTGPCGDKMCGWVVWASSQAVSDARDGGVAQLIGTKLLEDYSPSSAAHWSGTVFVPDMGRHFASQIEQVSPSQLMIKGCILGGLVCKTQMWSRIEQLPK